MIGQWFDGDGLVFGLFLIPGPKEIILVALVVMALYGRVGTRLLMSTRYGRTLAPWVRLIQSPQAAALRKARVRVTEGPEGRPATKPRRGRLFWALSLATAAALAAWVATRIAIHNATALPH